MARQVLIVAAHPDDEVLGCGGVASRHVKSGDRVTSLIVAEGATSRGEAQAGEVAALQGAARAAAETLGAQPPRFGGLPDNRLDSVALLDVVKLIEETAAEIRPEIVYTHHAGDLNIDHQIVAHAVATAFRPLPGAGPRALYAFETVSSTEWAEPSEGGSFLPSHFVDISDTLDTKLAALRCYESEMRDFPHPRSHEGVEALARLRGATAGLKAAEAFAVIREVVA